MVITRLRLRHIELFRNLCELGSLRKAADASSMTQPAATKLIHELEDMFGSQLFTRDRRGMRITPHGEIVRRHFEVLTADVANLVGDLGQFTGGGTGIVRLGIIPSLSPALLARAINELLAAHPRVSFRLHEAATNELLGELTRNKLDVIFGRVLNAGQAANLRMKKVYTEVFDIVCGKRHPLARKRTVGWKELAEGSWALPASGTPLRELAETTFTAQGVLRPRVAVASSSFHQMRFVIGAGQLLGVLPRSVASQGVADGDLVRLRPHKGMQFAPISLITRKDIEQPPLIHEFERIVMRCVKALKLEA